MLKQSINVVALSDEDGAVTVDWVVLTAAIVSLAVAGFIGTRDGVQSAASTVSTNLGAMKTK